MTTQDTSIKRKVMTAIMVTVVAVLLVTVAAFMIYDLATFRQTMARNITTQGRTLVENVNAALAFKNENDARSVLYSLSADPHIKAAVLYDAEGKLFVKYPDQISIGDLSATPQKEGAQFGRNQLTLFQPVAKDGRLLGTLYLQSDLTAITERLELYGGISLLIMLGSLLVAFWFSHTMQKRIADPIIALAGTARKISEQQDYSLRAEKLSNDELGLLADSFNTMLSRIQVSDAAVRASEAQFRLVTDQAPVLLAHVDRDYRYKFVNAPYAERYGRKPHEVIGKTAVEIVGEELFEKARPYVDEALAGQTVQFELEIPSGNRERRWSHVEYTPEKNPAGEVVGFVAMHTDITERKRSEEASRRLAAIVESSQDAIVSKNLNGIINSWNRGAEQLFGYSAEEAIGQPVTMLMPPDRLNEEPNILERIRRGERIEHYETIRQRKDGKLIEISLTVSPIKDAGGKVTGASKIARNISRQKQAERELEQAHKEAVAASRAKDDFLAALSHELRTPLNPVLLLASDAAENPDLPAEIRAKFATIRNNVELEARLIDDLLDINRITHGKLLLNLGPLDVHAVLKEAVATVQSELDEKHITLILRLAENEALMKGDAVRLQQVFWNVLKNAVKFNFKGGTVTIETSLLENGRIAVKITDTGIGMTSQELNHIFNAFSQGDHAESDGLHRFGGLGLGLTISRMLVELHSGVIHATSDGRDQGSIFTIELPLARRNDKNGGPALSGSPAKNDSPAGLKIKPGLRILLVEDHEPTRIALTHLLSRRNCQVMAATSVAEAQALAHREKFDLVVSDIGLPDGNGYALMSELREKFGLKGIALTGYGMEQDIARGQSAGFVAHLIKPVRVESLEKALCDAG
jgi:PAS domain S-box-containing protein